MVTILEGDSCTVLASLPDKSVQCCVTSPPYFGLRDYGHAGQIGLEPMPDTYVAKMVALFREVRRVLKDDGTLWINLGDSYARNGGSSTQCGPNAKVGNTRTGEARRMSRVPGSQPSDLGGSLRGFISDSPPATSADYPAQNSIPWALKEKDLIGIAWRVALALQADGWYLRSDIIWHKPNSMPESVTDRPTKAHEYVFLLSKSGRYFYDAKAISETVASGVRDRNARTVWNITTQPFKGAHFATMPPELAKRCILAGSRLGDTVLDPFGGAGTTGLVADRLGRNATLIELNPTYAAIARERIVSDSPLFAEVA
jgi:site-specific DNA-methyltransferase (adenine-specific)